MFFTTRGLSVFTTKINIPSLYSTVWVNFFKESFLIDFNYKVFFHFFITTFFYKAAFSLNYVIFNKIQLEGIYNLFTLRTNYFGNFISLKAILFIFFKSLVTFFLVMLLLL